MTGAVPEGSFAVRDPGLQPERTRLAWRRTTLTCTVVAVLAARTALHHGPSAAGVAACALTLLLWLGFLAVAHRRITELAVARPRALDARAATAAALCAGALVLCALVALF
ncbi:hypothetical protein C9F11_09100 [Streptomyces sp. YIM 121038]|nr:hypothetical protein C9F11_09100 [Streptomyces sp. YIM 121038]